MSIIVSVKTEHILTHLAGDDFVTAYGKEPTMRHHVIVKIASESGEIGFGEACPLPFTKDDDPVRIKSEIDDQLALYLIGKDALNQEVYRDLTEIFPNVSGTARTGVDLALYDLAGKIQCVPAYQLLGGLYRDHVKVAEAIGIGSPESVANEAIKQASLGIKTVKVKVGLDVERDIKMLSLLRDTVGDTMKIRADANAGYSFQQAVRVLREAEKIGIEYMEQPLAVDDYNGLRQLRKSSSVPIMVDESLYTFEDANKLVQNKAADMFGLKLMKHGGIYQSKRISMLAEENGIECVFISPWETQIGIAAAVHLILSGANFNLAHEIGPGALKDDPFKGLVYSRGRYLPTHNPGFGIE